jgi:hypothetical protein
MFDAHGRSKHPAVVLMRAAAARVRELTAAASSGPWTAEDNDGSWDLYEHAPSNMHPMKILKAPKRNSNHAEYWPEPGDAAWILAMSPHIGEALAIHFEDVAIDMILQMGRLGSSADRAPWWLHSSATHLAQLIMNGSGNHESSSK